MKAKKLLALTLALILALSCMSITAFAENATYLDLEEGDDYLDTKTGIEQTYTATVTTNKTDKTKVEVSWKLENIAVSVTNNKVWDTEKLTWVDDTANQNTAEANDVTAEFDFVNLSSINIDAQVTFEVADGFTAVTPTFTDNGVTEKADGIITLGTKADGEDTDNDGEIKATISPVDADFATLTENKTEQNYGTYTVTIREQAPAKTVCATFKDGTTLSWEELKAKYNVTDTSIGDGAFAGTNIVSIIIPDGVTSIDGSAFNGCTSLETITIPDSVESIAYSAFEGCTSLKEITIPNSVTSIGNYAFMGCTSLNEITIPDGVTSIGDYAFYGCESLKTITIPNSVISIGNCAFANCVSLETITIPGSVELIRGWAFAGCINLKIDCSAFTSKPDGWKNDWNPNNRPVNWGKKDTVDFCATFADNSTMSWEQLKANFNDVTDTSIGEGAFAGTNIVSITIPNSVTSIGECAFASCFSLETITIPDSVTSISKEAFLGCESLETITIPNSVTSIGSCAFAICPNLTIYCSAEQQPDGWDSDWNIENCYVIWGN